MENQKYEKMAEILTDLIKKDSKTVKAFAEKIEIPYTTLYTMLNKNLSGTSVNTVISVCKSLGITIEELEAMANGTRIINDDKENDFPMLDEVDLAFAGEVRKLTKEDKENLLSILKSMNKNK